MKVSNQQTAYYNKDNKEFRNNISIFENREINSVRDECGQYITKESLNKIWEYKSILTTYQQAEEKLKPYMKDIQFKYSTFVQENIQNKENQDKVLKKITKWQQDDEGFYPIFIDFTGELKKELINFEREFIAYNNNKIIGRMREAKRTFKKQVSNFWNTHGEDKTRQILIARNKPETLAKVNYWIEKWKKETDKNI